MTRIYSDNPGSCIEPGGLELDYETYPIDCPNCGQEGSGHTRQAVEGGSINTYRTWSCGHCFEGGEQ